MKLLEIRNQINTLLANLVAEVKGATALGQTDINNVAVTVLIPLFAKLYGFKNLKDLNLTDKPNFPAVDLGDDDARVAIQVTATSDQQKIQDTLRQFAKHGLQSRFDRVIVYILTEKRASYSSEAIQKSANGAVKFDVAKDVQDYRDVQKVVQSMQLSDAQEILDILEKNVAPKRSYLPKHPIALSPHETVNLNLLEISFPETIYVATIKSDDHRITKHRGRSRRRFNQREELITLLHKKGLRFASDWECWNNQIITFHDLTNEAIPLSQLLEQDTVESMASSDFFGSSDDQERVFKSLLRRCLQQQLYRLGVQWQNIEHIFIFGPRQDNPDENERYETWQSKRENARRVYHRVYLKHKPEAIWYCEHFAFQVAIKRFIDRWYLALRPDWFYSFDGYKVSSLNAEKSKYKKRVERNSHVANHFRFLVHFLAGEKPLSLFEQNESGGSFLKFGEPVSFNNSPLLDDSLWLPPSDTVDSNDEDDQQQLGMTFDL